MRMKPPLAFLGSITQRMIEACSGLRAKASRESRSEKKAMVPKVKGNRYQTLWPRSPGDCFSLPSNRRQRHISSSTGSGPLKKVAPTNCAVAWPIGGVQEKSALRISHILLLQVDGPPSEQGALHADLAPAGRRRLQRVVREHDQVRRHAGTQPPRPVREVGGEGGAA